MSFPEDFIGLDEMERYLGYDDINDTSLDFFVKDRI